MIDRILALLFEGAATGGLYVTIALGLSLVAGVMRLLNLAQGEILVGSVYVMLMLTQTFHFGAFASLLGTLPIVFVAAYWTQRSLLQALLAHGGEAPLVATFGLSIAGQAAFLIFGGPNAVSVDSAIGVTGVPFFIFAGRIGVPGAQDVPLLRRAMSQARVEMNEKPAA